MVVFASWQMMQMEWLHPQPCLVVHHIAMVTSLRHKAATATT